MKKLIESRILHVIVLSVVLGGASGVFATAMTNSYLSSYTLQLNELTQSIRINNDGPKSFPNSYSDAMKHFTETSQQSVVSVFLKSSLTPNGYLQESSLATGVVVTSDGWIIAPNFSLIPSVPLSVQIKNEVFDITNVIIDPLTQVVFLKCSANNLSVVGFGSALKLSIGDQLFTSPHINQFVQETVLEQLWQQGTILSSDIPSRRVLLSQNVFTKTTPVFDLSGSFVGFVSNKDGQTLLAPFDEILPALNALLEKKNISHPSLGVFYLDLAHAVGISDAIRRNHTTGALVTGHPVVKKGTPAQISGLMEGDIIISVNGEELDSTQGLNEVVMKRHVGESVSIAIDRKGEKKILTVILGEYTK